jgi:hypothetical protein
MSEMTSLERLEAALEGLPTDHIPFSPNLAYVWETSFPREVQWRGLLAFMTEIGADPLWRGAPCPVKTVLPDNVEVRTFQTTKEIRQEVETPVGTICTTRIVSPAGNTHFLTGHPLKTEADFQTQLWLEEHARYELDLGPVYAHLQGAGRVGLSIGMLIPDTMKSAYQGLIEHYAGTEEMVYAMADYPDTVQALWHQMVENHCTVAQMAVEAPYQYFITWEDSGTQNYSPRLYRDYIAPEITRWVEILKAGGKQYIQHACGHLRALLPMMQAQGEWGVESISPPPTGNISIAETRAMVGDRYGIIGGIEPVAFLDLSLKELGPYVEQVISEGRGGPFVLANSDSCPPGVTMDKFRLAAQVAHNTPG